MTRLKKAYSFNDVMMVPRRSSLNSRDEASLATKVAGLYLDIPIIAANMSSVCEAHMAISLGKMGGLGILHRMCSIDEQRKMLEHVRGETPDDNVKVGFSIGIGDDWRDRMDVGVDLADIVCLDIAHAHHERVIELLHKYFGIYKHFPIIIGQVSTPQAVGDLLSVIPDRYRKSVAFKTSIGGGSLCTTRIKTGFGVPTLQSIFDIAGEFPDISLIADGGIKESGDIVKSLAAGADAVMLGSLLAGTDEAPGSIIKNNDGSRYKVYRGSASFGDKAKRGEQTRNIEGEESLIPYKGSVERTVNSLLDGIRSGYSYGGATTIEELQDSVEFLEISVYGYNESLPHGK